MKDHLPEPLASALEDASSAKGIETDIWSWSGSQQETPAPYDSMGGAYDRVGGLDIYHRIFWGISTRAYRAFAEKAVQAGGGGLLLDAGCGSMLFSARAHRQREKGSAIGADASIEMLKRARTRLGTVPCPVVLLRTDILHTPFRTAVFDAIVCLHVAHVMNDLEGLVREFRRVLKPGGKLFLTSAVLVDHWRDRYLGALSRRGIMAPPRRPEDLLQVLQAVFETEPQRRLVGSMLFAEVSRLAR